MSVAITFKDSDGEMAALDDVPETTRERFEEIKEIMRRRNGQEITNEYVLARMLDVWWHHETEEVPS